MKENSENQEVNNKNIILNRIKTPDGTILTSYHVHDYQTYIDKNGLEYMVDGGTEYLRRNVQNIPYEELSIYDNAPYEIIRKSYHRGGRGKDGKQPLTWIPLYKMSNSWLKACIEYNIKKGLKDSFANKMYKKELKYRKENNIFIND